MTQDDETGTERADDYEYDLAHEARVASGLADHETPLLAPEGMHVTDDAGDYNYDAAHDRL